MSLPADLKREFEAAGGTGPTAVARALYDIEGNLGETYIATDGRKLALYSRRAGEPRVARYLDLAQISQMDLQDDRTFLHLGLRLGSGETVIQLKFSSWDRARLRQIAELWSKASGRTASDLTDAAIQAAARDREARDQELTPLVAFCAGIHAMVSIDGHVDQGELLVLSRTIRDSQAVGQGMDYLTRSGIDRLLSQLAALLTPAQKRCLLANLLAVGMADGLWRASEQELIERYRVAVGLSSSESQAIADVLMAKYGLAVLAEEEITPEGICELTPVSAFCASLHAMTQCDNGVAAEEIEYLSRMLQDPDAWAGGAQYLADSGVDHLLSQLPGRLGPAQKRCLIANLLGVAMADGLLRGREQELLERFREALAFPFAEYAAIQDVLMTKNNLQVFA